MTRMYTAQVTGSFPVEVEAETQAEAIRHISGVLKNASVVAIIDARIAAHHPNVESKGPFNFTFTPVKGPVKGRKSTG